MAREAFKLSEELGLPVILRPTTRTCHVCQDVEVTGELSADSCKTGLGLDLPVQYQIPHRHPV